MAAPDLSALGRAPAAGLLQRTATSHIGFRVPDVARAADFYGRVLGLAPQDVLPDGGVRLGWGSGHHVVDLRAGEPRLDHFGFEVRDEAGLEGVATRLADAGLRVDSLDAAFLDEAVTAAGGIASQDPDGNTVHFHGPVRRSGETGADTAHRPIRYQHVTLATDDLPAMVDFYVGVVGFRVSDVLSDGRFAWLRSNRDHHTLAVVQTGHAGLDHYSYDLAEWADFKSWCDRLTEQEVDVTWGPGRHGPGNNLFVFFDDPAGNHIELSAEMEKFHDDRVEYALRRWDPVPRSVNLWGGQLASWRRTSKG
jgi:catechol 2,3-dioxygenase-like lactoylglutathione lyase family enzyme